MLFGILLNGLNIYRSKQYIEIFTIFIPQIVLFTSLFGYMAFLIVVKWMVQNSESPSITKIMIDLVMKLGSVVIFIKKGSLPLWG